MIVYLNGLFIPLEDAKISVLDRGFIFGDAVYEVWRAVGGQLFEPDRHLARLASGLKDIHIAPPADSKRDGLLKISDRLMRDNNLSGGEASLFLEISRGTAPRAHAYPKPPVAPTVFIMASEFQPPEELRGRGGAVICIDDVRWNRCNVKTTQLLPNVMAKQEAAEHDALDAIFVRDGLLTETSHANVMAVIDGAVWTHPINGHVLPGVTRDIVLEIAASLGITVREMPIQLADLPKVTEMFLTGTLSDVMPIVTVDGKKVGDGRPGPIARKLFTVLRARLDALASGMTRG